MRVLRFAFGVTTACALAYGINWPLAFLMPVFTAMILAMPLPKPSVKASLNNMMSTLQGICLRLGFFIVFFTIPNRLLNYIRFGVISFILLFKPWRFVLVYLNVDDCHFSITYDCQ